MADQKLPERWLCGPLPHVAPVLQPAAHALLQARDEIVEMMQLFPEALLWHQPAGMASPAFHLQHIAGVLGRLSTYARNAKLSEQQMAYLKSEGKEDASITKELLMLNLNNAIDAFLHQIENTPEAIVTDARKVGRAGLPSTVIGLLFHAAEHTMRHTGQLLVTIKVLQENRS